MKRVFLSALTASILAAASAYAMASSASYTKVVHLRDGRQVTCVVNDMVSTSPSDAAVSEPRLTTSERVEAELDATARLRRVHPDKNKYPDPTTAPRVSCT
jgi:hypothetical protein